MTGRALFVLSIPATPPKEATKNWHGSWRTRAKAIAEARAVAGWAIRDQLTPETRAGGLPDTLDLAVTVWFPRGQRRYDDDSLIPALAGYRDAIAEQLGHRSDHFYRIVALHQMHVTDGEPPSTVIAVCAREEMTR